MTDDLEDIESMMLTPSPSIGDFFRFQWVLFRHKFLVIKYLFKLAFKLMWRALIHDNSKFNWKKEGRFYASVIKSLQTIAYGSEEYKRNMFLIKPAIDRHFARNRHHPEFFDYPPLTEPMSAIDEIEMICDWAASSRNNKNGDPYKSVQINAKRFKYGAEKSGFYRKLLTDIGAKSNGNHPAD